MYLIGSILISIDLETVHCFTIFRICSGLCSNQTTLSKVFVGVVAVYNVLISLENKQKIYHVFSKEIGVGFFFFF